jgi:hypothetical protein
MAQWLKILAAGSWLTRTVIIGPLVDSVDATKEEGLTITSGEVMLWKQGGTSFNAKNESSAAVHRGFGMYSVLLDETDLNTLGMLEIAVFESGIMVATKSFMVVPANVWDSYFSTDKLQVDTVELNSVAASAAKLERSASTIVLGTVETGSNPSTVTYFEAADFTEATADHMIGRVVIFTSGVLIYQATDITDYALVGSNGAFTVTALTEAAGDGDTFVVV